MQYLENPQDVNRTSIDSAPDLGPPPFNLEAEQIILGTILLWNEAIEDADFLSADHFFDPLHQRIYELTADFARGGRRANAVTLAEHFAGAPPVNPDMTVVQYLGHLCAQAMPRSHLRDYARLIADLYTRRMLILAGEDLAMSAREAASDTKPSDLIEDTEARLFALAERAERSETLSLGEAALTALEAAGRAYAGEQTGINTGLVDLDRRLGGLQPSDLVILAGRPSMGKTALATNIATNIARAGTPIGFFSMEMSAEQLAFRVLAERTAIASSSLRAGKVTEHQLIAIKNGALQIADLPFFIDETGGLTIAQVVSRARRMKRKQSIGLLVIDYLQIMQASGKRRDTNRVQDITEITIGLKALAKELRIPVVALSQLSRNVEHRTDKRPQLSDLRESGSIEQDADVVMFVFREEYYIEREQPSVDDAQAFASWQSKLQAAAGKAEVVIGKQRHGPIGSVQLAFNGELTKFSSLAGEGRHGL